jgi:predicted nucleic acid-binding protein
MASEIFVDTSGFYALLVKRIDSTWSFTDCLSFHIMKELRLGEALTKDVHFQRAGFTALLCGS